MMHIKPELDSLTEHAWQQTPDERQAVLP